MGEVWVADQAEPVRRRVALKVVRPGLDSARLLARFDQERQALALMDHPNIAKVLDAGVDEAGRPYFAMELIEGVPITTYCDEARLAPAQRLELFLPVCHAVQHAHQKGVIHRDLKPSNLLVAVYDGRPVPKVIDFGVAKATGPRLTEQSIDTEVGSLIGTLEYMSPEQAELNNLDIDTRADVYALGVVLYELLTGTVPFPRREFQGMPLTEMLRVIREADPPKPSTRLRKGEGGRMKAEKKAPIGSVSSFTLHPSSLQELDWIVLKCLEKDRARRYQTANGLARDIERYLHEEPVEAGPPSGVYRLRKFARRNRKLLAAAAAFVLLLAGGAGVSIWQAVRATWAERAASKERDRANEQAAVAKAVNDFLQNDLLLQATVYRQAGRKPDPDIKVRTLLDRAAAKVAGKFEGQPLVEAEIRNTLAITYDLLGDSAQAAVHAARARDLFLAALGPDDLRTVNATNNLANTLKGQRRLDEARQLYEEVLQVSRRALGPDHPATLGAMNNLAVTLGDLGRWDEARKLHEEALEVRRRLKGPTDPATLQSMNNLAVVLRMQGRLDEARTLHEETLQIQRDVLGPLNPETLGSMHNIAFVLGRQGRFAEAIQRYDELLPLQRQVLRPEHPARLEAVSDLAWLLANASDAKYRDAPRAVELAKEVIRYSPDRGDRWNTLGVAHYRAGDWKDAVTALEKSLALAPEESVADNGFFLAMAHWKLGDKDQARQWYDKATAWMEKHRPADKELREFRAEAAALLGLRDAAGPSEKDRP